MRIFIHNVDSYLGQVLVKELRKSEGGLNRIFGTVFTNTDNAPKVVKRVLSREDQKRAAKMIETIQSCSLVIIDLYTCSIDDLHFAISALKVDPKSTPPQPMGEVERSAVFVLISSVMTWSRTDVGEDRILKDSDYQRREPLRGARYELWKELEDLVFACFNREESKVKALVVASGILYGEGEDFLCPLFENAWRGRREPSISAPGSNRIPMVHVCDLARLVRQASFPLADGADVQVPCPYFLAVDQPPAPPPPPAEVKKEEEGKAEERGKKPANPEEGEGRPSSLASPTSGSRPGTAGVPAQDADDGEAADVADDEPKGEGEEEGSLEVAENGEAAAAEDLAPKWLPSTQAEIVQGIVDEFCEQYEVPIVATQTPSEPGTPRSDVADADGVAALDTLKPLVLSPEKRLRQAMTLNLRMKPSEVMLTEEFADKAEPPGWWCKEGLLKNVRKISDEFCRARKLQALRVLIAGPPASGKSTLARAVSEHFRIPHLQPGAKDWPGLPEELAAKVCRYRGYVLDVGSVGYEDAEKLFCIDQPAPPPEGEEEEEEEEEKGAGEEGEEGEGAKEKAPKLVRGVNKEICPAFVIVTQAPPPLCRAFWKKRAKKKHDIQDFERDMGHYTATNLDDSKPSLTDFFQDFCRLGVFNLPIAGKDRDDMLESTRIFMEKSGRPFNYLPTEEEVAAEILARRADKEQMAAAEEMVRVRSLRDSGDADTRAEQVRHMERMQLIEEYEEQRKHLEALALREYLMQNIVPTMTEGLIEVCKVLPENPLDYLATFLEQHATEDGKPSKAGKSSGQDSK
eukprot:CAMPEP_0172663264 /NCGR_PEP_ID=MMETSP1074-20121228/5811_1 /TAXON_ID=2916 /ORGANISM="Ceratium fusus, Strain PA161109" /LENGTH=800 /DNA_ID=CAMNT_0013479229 /DNA_START=140 /DNA_END=2542 /DNA_ORIENTATION=+